MAGLSVNTVKVEVIPENLEACRICLAWDLKLYNIREGKLDQTFVDLMGTTLSAWDGFPQYLCVVCRALLLKARALRERSGRADRLLKQSLMHQHFITNSFLRTIDRSAHNLTYSLSSEGGKVDVRVHQHEDTDIPQDNQDNIPTEDNIDDDNDANDDDDVALASIKIHGKPIENILKRKHVKNKTKKSEKPIRRAKPAVKKDKSSDKTKKEKLATDKTKAKRPRQPRKKVDKVKVVKVKPVKEKKEKRAETILTTVDDIHAFENKYKFQVQILSDEEMKMEVEKRKMSDKYQTGEYKCHICYNGFITSSIYYNHMKTHNTARGPHECNLCHVRFHYPAKLKYHIQNVHRLKFRCARCNEVVRGYSLAVLHAGYHDGTTFPCSLCDKQFSKKTSRASHMRAQHKQENASGGTCEICGETFTSRVGLKMHKTRSHGQGQVQQRGLKCRHCSINFQSIEALKKHKELQPNKKCNPKLSACEQCGATFENYDQLILHIHQEHGVELYTCDTCSKNFTSKASLATHFDRIHRNINPPKPYKQGGITRGDWMHWASICELCGKRLSCLATLKIHMNRHTGARPYKCKQCPKAYLTPAGLKNHLPIHTGVRKWRCPQCPATFIHQSSIYAHRKIHTGEKSHQCAICDKLFTQSGSLYTHIKYVHMKETPPPRKRNKKPAFPQFQ